MIPFKRTQPTPWQQLQCALMGVEGWIFNLEEGISTPEEACPRMREMLEIIQQLKPHLDYVQWEGPDDQRV